MNKEHFLAISLPHGLKGYVDGKGTISGQNIYILFNCPYRAATVEVLSTIVGESNFYTDRSKFKPILHPLTDLIRTIEHKEETFVPMYVLAKMQGFSVGNIGDWTFEYHNGKHAVCSATDGDWMLRYMVDEESFFLNGLKDWNKKHQKSRMQLSMFQKLIEWHFDVAELIEKGEAIDVNTLPENPYIF